MTEEKKIKVLKTAKYIIENKATIEMTAKNIGMSVSSIKKYINNDLPLIDKKIYNTVKEIQDELITIGRYTGSKNGKREVKYTDFEMMEIAENIIERGLTLDEASIEYNIPRSTISERIRKINDKNIQNDLDILYGTKRNR